MTTASAPAKAIILGEHTALYGNPALAMALDIRARVAVAMRKDGKVFLSALGLGIDKQLKTPERGTELVMKAVSMVGGGFDIEVSSEIPLASGMGSSAAISCALVAALRKKSGNNSDIRLIAEEATKCESVVHSKSSGLDTFVSAYGGVGIYHSKIFMPLEHHEFPNIIIAHSGEYSETYGLVRHIDSLRSSSPQLFKDFLEASRDIVSEGGECIRSCKWERLGELMYENHSLLAGMGVSSPRLDTLVDAARSQGAMGAKLSGAGRGGIMLALVDKSSEAGVKEALSRLNAKIIEPGISKDGVRLE
jgi:mevalonate kinase